MNQLRRQISISALGAAALALTCGGALHAQPSTAPLKVGLMTVKSGPAAALGQQMEDGLRMFLREHNNTLAGRPIELIVADTTANPAVAKTKFQELVERNQVQVIIGPAATFEALALNDDIRQAGIPVILTSAGEDLTQRKANPLTVRVTASSAQATHVLGTYAAKTLGYKRVAVVGEDLAFSHELAGGFQRTFEEAGGKVVQRLWSPFNTTDFATFIAKINPNVDAILLSYSGAGAIRFLKQYREFNPKGGKPLLSGSNTTDESVLTAAGDEAIGVISANWYSPEIQTAENRRYAANYRADFKAEPGGFGTGAYVAGQLLEVALKSLNGNAENHAALAKALHSATLTATPRGPLKLDAYGNPIATIYIRKTERIDGKVVNHVIATFPDVSQFYTYDPAGFLATPAYSRDYPPARYLE
jgi:branched-chain amino acid transport system substrate-binding protein